MIWNLLNLTVMAVLMAIEQRKEERHVAQGVSKGELYHLGSHQHIKVKRVCDISNYGACLHMESCLDRGEKVRLGFKDHRVHIQSYGSVAWCAPTEEVSGSFMMGVSI